MGFFKRKAGFAPIWLRKRGSEAATGALTLAPRGVDDETERFGL